MAGGGLVVFAAGNDGEDGEWPHNVHGPAYYEGAVAVAATDASLVHAYYTNYGSCATTAD